MKLNIGADRGQLLIFYIVSVGLILLDQLSKYWARDQFRGQDPQIFLNDFFRFDYAENPGAFLGMGNSLSDPMRYWIFVIFVFFLMLALAWYLHSKRLPRMEAWAYTLVFGGGIGNLIDRAFRPEGRVIDFMNMGIGSLRTGIFNLADVAIMGGLILLLLAPKAKKETAKI
jgi:signal peptidase II